MVEIVCRRMLVTLPLAKRWMAERDKNRYLSDNHLAALMRAWLTGSFQENGEGLIFNEEGRLVDGMHRVGAYVAAKEYNSDLPDWWVTTTWGVPMDAILTINTGRKRKLTDQLEIKGYTHRTVLGAALHKLAFFAYGMKDRAGLSIPEGIALLERHPKLQDSVFKANSIRHVARSTAAALHYIATYYQNEPEKALMFLRILQSGESLMKDCPVIAIREYLANLATKKVVPAEAHKAKIITHAWNCFRVGKTIQRVKIPEVVTLEGWTPALCFGEGVALSDKLTDLNRLARTTTAYYSGGRRSGGSYAKSRAESIVALFTPAENSEDEKNP